MQVEQHTFEKWGYPFIAQDYEGEFEVECPDATIGGIVVFKGDELKDIVMAVGDFISNKVPAIMVELCHIKGTILESDIVTYLDAMLVATGYKDLKSYEHRLSYGKVWDS